MYIYSYTWSTSGCWSRCCLVKGKCRIAQLTHAYRTSWLAKLSNWPSIDSTTKVISKCLAQSEMISRPWLNPTCDNITTSTHRLCLASSSSPLFYDQEKVPYHSHILLFLTIVLRFLRKWVRRDKIVYVPSKLDRIKWRGTYKPFNLATEYWSQLYGYSGEIDSKIMWASQHETGFFMLDEAQGGSHPFELLYSCIRSLHYQGSLIVKELVRWMLRLIDKEREKKEKERKRARKSKSAKRENNRYAIHVCIAMTERDHKWYQITNASFFFFFLQWITNDYC